MQAAIEEFVRRERLGVSTIALSQFMQGLFEDKLASQKQALLQGKQLADIIALESGGDSSSSIDSRGPASSTGTAARTLTRVRERRLNGAMIGGAAGAAVLVLAGATLWWTARPRTPPAPAAKNPVVPAAVSAVPSASPAPDESRAVAPPVESAAPVAAAPAPPPERKVPLVAKPVERPAPAAPPPVAVGNGKLNVAARGGWCNVTVDGAGRGPTPLAGVVLAAGTHTVTCTPEGGHPMTATVKVEADATARYSFTVPPAPQ